MSKFKPLLFVLPAVFLAVLAGIGYASNKLNLEEVVWPEEPDLSQYEVKSDADNASDKAESKDKSSDTKKKSSKKKNAKGNFEDGVYTGQGTGYGGITEVEVTVENGSITKIEVLSNHDDQTFFNRALTLIDTIIDEQSYDVDTVSGATYSSRGILEAVKNALTGSTSLSATPTVTTPQPATSDSYDDSASLTDGTYTGWHQGYGGLIYVSVTVTDGKIASVNVTDHSGETDAYYNNAKSIISNILSAQSPNVDTISGATYSSNGIREAVKMALKSAANPDSTPEPTPEATATPEPTAKPTAAPKKDGTPANGTYTGTAYCSEFDYTISVDATFKNGKCTKLSNFKLIGNSDSQNESYANKAWKAMKSDLKSNGTADTVSGATYSSAALQEAFNNAYNAAVAKNGGTTPTPKATATPTPKPTATPKPAEGSYSYSGTATVDKYNYDVTATLTFNSDGTLSGVSYETGKTSSTNLKYMTKAWDGMSSQFDGKTTTVDTVSKATLSSKALVIAYNNALKAAKKDHSEIKLDSLTIKSSTSAATPKPTATPTPSVSPSVSPSISPSDETYTYSGTNYVSSFGYNITVNATFKNGTLTDMTYSTDNDDEDNDEYIEDAWNGLNSSIKDGNTTVNIVTGATYSSKGIVAAYNAALDAAKKDHSDITNGTVTAVKAGKTTPTPKPTATPTPEPTSTPTPTPSSEEKTYTETVTCMYDEDVCEWDEWDDYDLTFSFTFKDGKLTDVAFVSSSDTSMSDYYSYALNSIKSSLISSQSADSVDVYCGATCSARAICQAYKIAKAEYDGEN